MFRNTTAALAIISLSSISAFANEDDHVVTPDTVQASVTQVVADLDKANRSLAYMSITNNLSVAIVLRDVKTDTGRAFMYKMAKIFGTTVQKNVDFLNINPGKTVTFQSEPYRLNMPKGSTQIELNFGPKGDLSVPVN
ncbi:copper chaperone PCu(A)C [Amylibacter sp. SFDW26]|uniref:copper chaperone PCu(A)C n=1 Tax=Amylibacter sp. SFDW26 TaxID=2652722 RepID=UPI0012614A35|nr:copper chaperone PCu(A)C [Amylibacter sp. SFDW26]KAB7616128.1 copper chaperone PCu(A)C [Amylibacter sp. SFDW26]